MATTFTKRIDATIRDVDHTLDSGTWYFDENSAWNIGNPGSATRNIGLRFTSVNVVKDASIISAKITFKASNPLYQAYPQNVTLKIQGVAEDNTAEFVASPESSARTRSKTTASVAWSGNVSETAGSNFDTPDITNIIQELVNRAGWSSGNAMAFFLSDNGSASGKFLEMDEYGDSSSNAALLTIVYVGSSISPSPSPSKSPSISPSWSPSIGVSASPSVSPSVSLSPSKSPSVSPSTSKSPSVSPSVSPSPEDMGIKVVKSGHDVNTETDIKNMIFTSARGILGLKQLTTYTKTTNANGNISSTDAHSIGYVPVVIVSLTAYDGNTVLLPIEWHSIYLNGSRETVEVTETVSFTIDATNIYFTVHAEEYNHDLFTSDNLSGRNYTFNVYYYFNEITELY